MPEGRSAPQGWRTCAFSDLCTLQRGFDITEAQRRDGTVPVFSSSGLSYYHSESRVRPPVVITGRKGLLGQVYLVNEPCWPHDTTLWVKDFRGNEPEFVYRYLKYMRLEQFDAATSVPTLNRNNLKDLPIRLPSRPEQRAIAAALSDVDALIGALDRLIAKKGDLKQAAMQQLLTGQTRLPGYDGHWTPIAISDLVNKRKDLFDDGDWIEAEYLEIKGIRLIQTGNIGVGRFEDRQSRKYISETSFKKLRCKALCIGDVLICRLADPAGRACVLPDIGEYRMITAVDVTIFRPPTTLVDRSFLVQAFSTRTWLHAVSERCGGSTRTRISRGELGRIPVCLPPLAEQTAIAAVLADMDAEITALEQRRDKTHLLKQGMMQELLTGRTRLV